MKITTPEEYNKANEELTELLNKLAVLTPDQEKRLDELSVAIEMYDDIHFPMPIENSVKQYMISEDLIKGDPELRHLVDNLVWWGVKYAMNIHQKNPEKIIKKEWIDQFTDCNLGLIEPEALTVKPGKFI